MDDEDSVTWYATERGKRKINIPYPSVFELTIPKD